MTEQSPSSFLYRDDKWLVVNKPTGLSTHAANEGDLGVAEWLQLHMNLKVHVFSRLDKGTSGVLVMALNKAASAAAQKIHESEQSKKTYLMISNKKHGGSSSWICREPLDGSACETAFKFIKGGPGFFLYQADITRGKTHQIRRHAESSGISVLGDDEHGGAAFPRLCLHCAEVEWPGIAQKLVADLPDSFEMLIAGENDLLLHTAAAYERRLNWLLPVTNAFRLIHRDEVLHLPFAVDLFGDWMCVTGFDETVSAQTLLAQIKPALKFLSEKYACRGGIIKTNQRNPHNKKLFGEMAVWGEPPPDVFPVHEHDLNYEISLGNTQHAGLFLDQRDSRQRLAQVAQGKRVANLFAFTCSFSAVAVKAGAEVAFSVDLASGCLEQGKKNFAQNHLTEGGRGKFIQEDVRTWLARQLRQKKNNPNQFVPWDLIVCDPPVFAATGHGHSFSVSKMWSELAGNVRAILSDTGIALFANNHRGGSDKFYLTGLTSHFLKVTSLRPPLDFPEVDSRHTHVRIYWCEV